MGYRAEIDGLRAIAVLPVILFHAGIEGLSGGFVGVDVFFVISGFLITGIIARELQAGDFSILRFYERRARRILPALFLVLAASSVAAYTIMLPYELVAFGQGLISVVLFVSNILFWQQSGYFSAASELNPLLHTWSLAVEEQFYIIFPLLLMVLWRWGMRVVWGILAVLAVLSLLFSEYASTRDASLNFYLLPTRAWELGVGALLALWLMRHPQPSGFWAEALGMGGLLAIFASVLLYGPATPFPSVYALLPVLGTAAVLYAAQPGTVAGRLLSWKPIVGIGLISYSAYLWHQPLFAFARLTDADTEPPLWAMLVLAGCALVLAWLSWRFVERPFRTKDGFGRGAIFSMSALGSAALIAFGFLSVQTGGFLKLYPESFRPIVAQGPLEYGEYVRSDYNTLRDAPFSETEPNLLIIGDSFSQDFHNMVRENGAFARFSVSTHYVPAGCQIHYGSSYDEIERYISAGKRGNCRGRVISQEQVDHFRRADVVVLAASWRDWSAARIAQTISAMDLPDTSDVFVVGSKQFVHSRRELVAVVANSGSDARHYPSEEVLKINTMLKSALPAEGFVDVMGSVCEGGCPLLTPDGQMISYDGGHLTQAGAAYIGHRLFTETPLSAFAAPEVRATQ